MTEHESVFGEWQVAFFHFKEDEDIEYVNAAVTSRPGWEPFAARTHPDGGWILLLRKHG
jgi:hypothetical protein